MFAMRKLGKCIAGLALLLILTTAAFPPSTYRPGAFPLGPAPVSAAGVDWPQFNFDARHSGHNPQETAVNTGNAKYLARLFQITLPGVADGAPAYLSGVQAGGATRDLLFVTTRAGDIVALDAVTGARVWSASHPAGSCRINNGSAPCYTTSSPAIDPNRQYVYSYGLDGRVHKHSVASGVEVTTGGWPETATLKGFDEKGSSALSIATVGAASFLYVTNGGYPGDRGDYQGHITAINLADGSQRVFNANCSDQTVHFVTAPGTPDCPAVQTAIWPRAGVVYDSDTGRLYTATGNGSFAPAQHNWGDSVIAIHPDGTGSGGNPLDSYTPANFQTLDNTDADLGSTAPAILPPLNGSLTPHLAVQGGKDAQLRLINLDNLSNQGSPAPGRTGGEVGPVVPMPQGGGLFAAPAVWTNPADNSTWVFVVDGNGAAALRLVTNGGTPALQTMWQNTSGGTSPVIAGGVLFYAGSGHIYGFDPATGAQLWSDASIAGIHWESPIVANGRVYITDESGQLTAYYLFQPRSFFYLPLIIR